LEATIFGILGIIIGNSLALAIDSFLMARPVSSPLGPITSEITVQLLVERSLLMILASVTAGIVPSYQVSKADIVSTIEKR
jgi:ABC-type lipoprotein release transport system permease subunit